MTNASNLIGLDYRAEARRIGSPPFPIIDGHAHVGGLRAAVILKEAMDLYGITEIWSMTSNIGDLDGMRQLFGDRIHFIAVPDWRNTDPLDAHGSGYARRIEDYYEQGARIAKFWAAPRGIDIGIAAGDPSLMRMDNPVRLDAMARAHSLGMSFMAHVADPDTWFATKYSDHTRYGSKASHYEPFERALDRFDAPWIAAHMGGWPEDLAFLDGLLTRHANLSLDTSATKWMVRELSRHSRDEVVGFFTKWRDRILFGSDIVTTDAHLSQATSAHEMDSKASTQDAAFDLYASRYWALRTLWETDRIGPSPIADPDLALVDPINCTEFSAPILSGLALPRDLLLPFYRENAERFRSSFSR